MRYVRGGEDETLFWKSKAIPPQRNELRKLSYLAFRGGRNEILQTFQSFPFLQSYCQYGDQISFFEVSRSQKIRHTHTFSGAPMNELSSCSRGRYPQNTVRTRDISSVVFEPAIPAFEGVQTYASDCTAIGISFYLYGPFISDRIFYRYFCRVGLFKHFLCHE